jgi:hypothetical protein
LAGLVAVPPLPGIEPPVAVTPLPPAPLIERPPLVTAPPIALALPPLP